MRLRIIEYCTIMDKRKDLSKQNRAKSKESNRLTRLYPSIRPGPSHLRLLLYIFHDPIFCTSGPKFARQTRTRRCQRSCTSITGNPVRQLHTFWVGEKKEIFIQQNRFPGTPLRPFQTIASTRLISLPVHPSVRHNPDQGFLTAGPSMEIVFLGKITHLWTY